VKELIKREFGLQILTTLPVTESYSSNVMHFSTPHGDYVVKSPYTIEKARRERDWLIALEDLPLTPTLLDYREVDDKAYILYKAIPGRSIVDQSDLTESTVSQMGKVLFLLHSQNSESFGGFATWHELLIDNVDRYLNHFAGEELVLAKLGAKVFYQHLELIPNSDSPVPVHFDFRPGNILLHKGIVTGLIDFESARGGHPSMDFTKVRHQLWENVPKSREWFLAGYGEQVWIEHIDDLLDLYTLYHGIGGLCWCAQRGIDDSDFYRQNKRFILAGVDKYR
jgi:aminoglycoside phosphotransferase (APT) family kinase protein